MSPVEEFTKNSNQETSKEGFRIEEPNFDSGHEALQAHVLNEAESIKRYSDLTKELYTFSAMEMEGFDVEGEAWKSGNPICIPMHNVCSAMREFSASLKSEKEELWCKVHESHGPIHGIHDFPWPAKSEPLYLLALDLSMEAKLELEFDVQSRSIMIVLKGNNWNHKIPFASISGVRHIDPPELYEYIEHNAINIHPECDLHALLEFMLMHGSDYVSLEIDHDITTGEAYLLVRKGMADDNFVERAAAACIRLLSNGLSLHFRDGQSKLIKGGGLMSCELRDLTLRSEKIQLPIRKRT